MKRRFQNKIAESSVTLPTACVVATLLWWLPQGGYSTDYLLGWILCALTTYILIETTAVNVLLRIRSRMISSLYLFMMAVCGFLHPLQTGSILQFCMALSFYCLLRTCEKPRPQTDTLHAHLLLSIASLLWPPLLLLNLIQLWNQGVYLRSLSWRSFGAALCGILLPYAFWASGAFVLSDIMPFVHHATGIIAPFTEPFYWQWAIREAQTYEWHTFWSMFLPELWMRILHHPAEALALVVTLLLGMTGFLHYVRKNYDDKIRVRMCHYTFMSMQLVVVCWIMLQPTAFPCLFPLLLLTTVPAAAHFMALTHTWLTNVWTVLLLTLLVGVGAFIIWSNIHL
ncbi:MAG: hypothetical protein IJT75_02395 [Bacteroidaceae bacterium]|nr:hypothetical protein [Bacteroidaceae bacterium]